MAAFVDCLIDDEDYRVGIMLDAAQYFISFEYGHRGVYEAIEIGVILKSDMRVSNMHRVLVAVALLSVARQNTEGRVVGSAILAFRYHLADPEVDSINDRVGRLFVIGADPFDVEVKLARTTVQMLAPSMTLRARHGRVEAPKMVEVVVEGEAVWSVADVDSKETRHVDSHRMRSMLDGAAERREPLDAESLVNGARLGRDPRVTPRRHTV